MPTEIQTPTAGSRLASLFKLTGRHKLLIDEVVVPVVLVGDVSSPLVPENERVVYRFVIGASAAADGKAVLFNGVTNDTGRDIIINKVTASVGVAGTWALSHSTNAPTNPIGASVKEASFRQWPQVGTPPGTMFSDSGAFVGSGIITMIVAANAPWEMDVDVTLGSFQALVLTFAANNQSFRCSFFGSVIPRL